MSANLEKVLRATGYVEEDAAGHREVEGLFRGFDAGSLRLEPAFSARAGLGAGAVYQGPNGPMILVKDSGDREPEPEQVAAWHERAWNLGIAPLLWVVTPSEVRVFNAYSGVGSEEERAGLASYRLDAVGELDRLDAFCGRFAVDTGEFWKSPLSAGIDRSKRVDRVLLEEIAALEDRLCVEPGAGRPPTQAEHVRGQALIMSTLFAAYLMDRGIARDIMPAHLPRDLAGMFESAAAASALFDWLHETFNGDVFPAGMGDGLRHHELSWLRRFATSEMIAPRLKGQLLLFRFRFDTIPIELISSVYEEFARRSAGEEARKQGLHYTPVELVHMALDPVFEGLDARARVLDPTCGSGLFLVQALRRLVFKRYGTGLTSRQHVRDILYRQIFGVDINPAALRIAAFSLYLAVIELEDSAGCEGPLRFERLIGRNLHEADFLTATREDLGGGPFDAIVGNPPWTHVSGRRPDRSEIAQSRRSADQEFLFAALRLAGPGGRVAMYLKATPFYSRDTYAAQARSELLRRGGRVALVDFSNLRSDGLFPGAQAPAMLFCANCANLPPEGEILLGTVPWTPDFARSGSVAWSSAEAKVVPIAGVLRSPSSLKAVMRGTFRDARLIERLEGPSFVRLGHFLDEMGIDVRGQGWQRKGEFSDPIPEDMRYLPTLKPEDYTVGRIDTARLPTFAERGLETLHRARNRDIYRSPLLLCPKSAHKRAFEAGRFGASLSEEDVAFNEGFYGISFHKRDSHLAPILCALLNSPVASFQFLFGAGGLGAERPTIGPLDFLEVRVPSQLRATSELAATASDALALAASGDLLPMDELSYDAYGLDGSERRLVADSVGRGKSAFLSTYEARQDDLRTPTIDMLSAYASSVCRTVNAFLDFAGRRHLVAEIAMPRRTGEDPLDSFAAVRLSMRAGSSGDETSRSMGPAAVDELFGELRERLVRRPLPYLRERRSIRVYGPDHVTVIKPAQVRYWSVAAGMQDGDTILSDHWMQTAA